MYTDDTENIRLNIINILQTLAHECNVCALEHGFWDDTVNYAEKQMLVITEIAEEVEAYRKDPNMMDDHLPQYPMTWVEKADVIIRELDQCGQFGIPIGEVILAKLEYNKTRPHKHGKLF